MATGGHWVGGSVGTRGDYHFGDEMDNLMEGDPALLIGAEGGEDIELDCDEATIGCGMPKDNPWAVVEIAGDVVFGMEGPVAKLRNWWAKRQAARLAALAPKRRRAVRAPAATAQPGDSGDDSLDLDTEAAPPGTSSLAIGAGGLVMGPDVSLSDRSFI